MKAKCKQCGKEAVWMYMPSGEVMCDNCVPRGCSCNIELKSGVVEKFEPTADGEMSLPCNPPEDYEETKDDQGRLLPCCEWAYNKEGFEEDDSPRDVFQKMYEASVKKANG